jgi:predicted thioesterase
MNASLQPGVSLRRQITVDRDRTIEFLGEQGRIYATPSLIMDIEQTCRELILNHADEGEDSVGMEVSVRHSAATLPGMTVEIEVRVAAVEDRKVVFDVGASDDLEPISGGTHTRFVVDKGRMVDRLQAKAAQYEALAT